jgi:uncharacterized OB-fold protein
MPEGKPETVFDVVDKDGMLVQKGRIKVPYTWAAGKIASRFLVGLRDEKRIYGVRCPSCGTVFVPPKKLCHKCMVEMSEWVELGDEGVLEAFTIVRYSEPAIHTLEPPFACGIIRLDGADTGMVHLIGEADLTRLEEGQRMRAVFSEERKGEYLDIAYFKPV